MTGKEVRNTHAEALLERLRIAHPVLKHCRPLDEATIEAALIEAQPKEAPWLIRLALHIHLNSDAYLQSLSHGGPRYGLDGAPTGEVEPDARHHARALLRHHQGHRHKHPG